MMQACDTMPEVVTVQQSFAASCHEGLGFEGRKRARVLKLELLEPHDGGGIKLKNKILHPGAAVITWDPRSSETVVLSFLKSGEARDVFAVAGLCIRWRSSMLSGFSNPPLGCLSLGAPSVLTKETFL